MQVQQISDAVNGELTNRNTVVDIDTLLIDSRKIIYAQNSLFVCLVTSRDNGHHYIKDAYNKGVRVFLISEVIYYPAFPEASFILVPNSLDALQQLVAKHRKNFNYPVIGITGSNGKTIVKEWLFQLLDDSFNIIRSPKSYNSQVGVALSVWEMHARHDVAIFEAGVSEPNEMKNLQKIIQPTIGIFTNIGDQHSEYFATVEQKINEKLELFTSCETLIYCSNHHVLQNAILHQKDALLKNCALLTWGNNVGDDLYIVETIRNANTTSINAKYKNQNCSIDIPFFDEASLENIMHCWLTALHLNVPQDVIAQSVLSLVPVAMRLELKKGLKNCVLINDSYNSDIGALQIALDFLVQQKQNDYYTVILSDILQSNKSDVSLYEEVAELLAENRVQKFIGIGPAILEARPIFLCNSKMQCAFYENTEAFIEGYETHVFENQNILIKGARKFQFEKINSLLEEKIHQTVLEINLNAIAENFNAYSSLLKKDVAIMAMVKAFSYGSGAYEIANKLQFLGIEYLAVAYVDEGVLLRKSGISLPIMVMNPDIAAFDTLIENNLEPEIYSKSILQKFIAAVQYNELANYPIHVKVDTGMHRLGFTEKDLEESIDLLTHNNAIKIQSVFSHLAASDDVSLDEFTNNQAAIFDRICNTIHKQVSYSFFKHICNTSGIVRHPNLHYNMVRLGVGLYGVDNSEKLHKKIKNVSRMKTKIAQLKYLTAGETVGYSRKGVLNRASIIGTVCVGYADGISRTLSNGNGKMYVNGVLAPIVGNVCMDMCMLDVTDVPNVQEGNEVVIFGPELPITQVAAWANTIPYEIMTDVSTRVKRVYFEE
jgi:Alr-MurF fusion protein